ncbi:MAG TPA: hypothetical protein VFD57_05965 [Clostridia bacterium]|nr:hypothetical protein [Clostridia bacterium]
MKDTIIVFWGMAILLSLPPIFYAGRCIIRSKKEKGFKNLYYRLAGAGLVLALVIVLAFNIYGFTIRYQAPLVAEQFLEIFTLRDEENMEDHEYLEELIKADLVMSSFEIEDYSYMEEMGIKPRESILYLGENIYENDDGTSTLYSQFEFKGKEVFTAIDMKQHGDKWSIIGHRIISHDLEDYPETKKRFYPIR